MLAEAKTNDWKKSTQDIDKIWLGLREGKQESLSILFFFYYNHLFNYGCNMVRNKELVKDCIQELFLTLWDSRRKINEAYSVKSYLFISLRRTVFRKLKRRKNRTNRNHIYAEEYFVEPCNIEKLIVRFETDTEKKDQLAQSLNSLSARQKEAIYLKFYDGLSNNEIAQVMDINKQSVYNHISQAILRMKDYVTVI